MEHMKVNIKTQILIMFCTLALITGIFAIPSMANAEEVSKISIDSTKTTLKYVVGSTIDLADVYIYINGAASSTQCSTLSSVIINAPKNSAVGRKTVTISYGGQIASYEIKVIPKAPIIYTLKELDFDTIRAYSNVVTGVDGCNFRAREAGSTTSIYMGLTATKNSTGRYYDKLEYLDPGTKYYFKVRTYKVVDGERFYSNWSAEKSYTLPTLYGAERWRPEIKKQLEAHGVYSKYRENIIVNIIDGESGGCETAGAGSYYVGLMQYGAHWKHDYSKSYFSDHDISNFRTDNRLSGSWNIHRAAILIKYGGGTDALKQHWPNTWDG